MDPKKVKLFDICTFRPTSLFVSCGLTDSLSLCRALCFWWRMSCSDTLQKTSLSSSTKERASTRLLQEITLEKGAWYQIFSALFLLLYLPFVTVLSCYFAGMTSTSKFFRLLLTSMSSLISTSSRPSGKLCLFGMFFVLNQGQNLLDSVLAFRGKQTFSTMESPTLIVTSGQGGKCAREQW